MTILLDIHGVCADFVTPACKLFNKTPADIDWPEAGYHFYKHLGIEDPRDFWSMVELAGDDFWAELEPYPWYELLVEELRKLANGFLYLASSPAHHPTSLSGTKRWIEKHFSNDPSRYVLTPHKRLLAGPGRVLIDDFDRNIHQFNSWRGLGLLFPQPWNYGSSMTHLHDDPEALVRFFVNQIKASGIR